MIRRFPIPPGQTSCPLRPGETYRRKIRGVQGVPTIRVHAIRVQLLRDVTHADALAEGYGGRRALASFRRDWVRDHDQRRYRAASDATVDARWRTHHAAKRVYVVELALIDPTRNLPEQRDVLSEVARRGAQRERAGREPDARSEYVTSGGIDRDAEAVDPETLASLTADALERRANARLNASEQRHARRRARLADLFDRPL